MSATTTAERTARRTGVVQHFVYGDRQSAVETHDHHGQRIADQNEVDSRLVHQSRSRIVVGGQRGDRLPEVFLLLKVGKRYFCRSSGRNLVRIAEMRDAHIVSSVAPR